MINSSALSLRGTGQKALLSMGVAFSLMLMGLLVHPNAASATTTNWPQNTTLTMTGPSITLTILAGSKSDSLATTSTTFTVTVASGDTFTVRYPGPTPGRLPNDGGFNPCQLSSGNNDVAVAGPVTVVFTPTTTVCSAGGSGGSGGGGGGGGPSYSLTVTQPNGGESLATGTTTTIGWTSNVSSSFGSRVSLSTDGGSTFSTLATFSTNNGSYSWGIPSMTTTTAARIKVEALSGTSVVASDVSNANFTINGTAPTTPPTTPPVVNSDADPTVAGNYTVSAALNATANIDTDKTLPSVTSANCTAGTRIKGSLSAVYYCGRDGKRYVFPNEKTYFSWFADFSGVVTLSDAVLANIPLGGNVTSRPGRRMVKIQTDPKVYAISRGGTLRWVTTEAIAAALYGPNWNQQIDDVSDAFFVNYQMGTDLTSSNTTL